MTEARPTMTVQAASAALDVHVNTIRNWIRRGVLEARARPGPRGSRRPYLDSVLALIDHQEDTADLDQLRDQLRERLFAAADRYERRAVSLRVAAGLLYDDN